MAYPNLKQGLQYEDPLYHYIPDISIQEASKPIGRFGRMRRKYLQEENPIFYNDLILTEKLFSHLLEVEEIAQRRFSVLMEQMKVRRNITEELKQENPMRWIGEMNNIRACIDEIIVREIICE